MLNGKEYAGKKEKNKQRNLVRLQAVCVVMSSMLAQKPSGVPIHNYLAGGVVTNTLQPRKRGDYCILPRISFKLF